MVKDTFYGVSKVDGVCVINFRQHNILDAMAIERMVVGLKELVGGAEEKEFVFGFEEVSYLSSSALGMLIGIQRRVAQRGANLKLAGINDEIMEVFRITRLDTVFDIYKNTAAAVAACRKGRPSAD